jgi:hypothetical protein
LGQLKLTLPLLLLLTISFVTVFADTSGDISVISGKTYLVHYEAKDSQVKSVEINKDSQSLVFSVQVSSQTATLQLTLPRELIDATKSDGTDDKFIVLADGAPISETEKNPSSLARTLFMPLTSDVTEIEIIGTHIGTTTAPSVNTPQSTSSPTASSSIPVKQRPIENKTTPNVPNPSPALLSTYTPQTNSIQDQILQKITSLLHLKPESLSLEITKKQIVEYSIIAAIVLIVIIVIASSARSKSKKPIRK